MVAIQAAADVFSPVYERTGGQDGYVSIEVAPEVAGSTPPTIAMAEDLPHRCDRPDVMVKIPATPAGIPAIRDKVAQGHNINVTLISKRLRPLGALDWRRQWLISKYSAAGDR